MTERMKKLEELLKDDKDNPFLLFAVAKEYEGMNADQQALDQYLALQQHTPSYVGLYYHLGKLQEKREDFEAAEATYRRGMEVAKAQGDMHAHGELSTALWEVSED